MEENVLNLVDETVMRINQLAQARIDVENKKNELDVHERDLKSIANVLGVESKDYLVKKNLIDIAMETLKECENKVEKLSFKKSELKPALDAAVEEFQNTLKLEQERVYEIQLGEFDERGFPMGRRAFTQLMTYIEESFKWTAKTLPQLMVLHSNMKDNETHVKSKKFDNIIKLRSSSVMVLYHSITESLEGKGYNTGKYFMTMWANMGSSLTNAVRDITKSHETTRELGAKLNLIEDEFEKSFDDLPHDEEVLTTKDEVAPEV